MRRILLAIAMLLAAAPGFAYVIYLKDGSSLTAREKYQVKGATALITLPNGAQTTLPLAQIDVAKTQAGNASDYGDATVLAVATPAPTVAPPPQLSLAQLAAQRRAPPPPPTRATPVAPKIPPPAAAPEAAKGALLKTPAGYVDFLRTPRTPVGESDLATAVGELLHAHGLTTVAIYEGSAPKRLLIEVTANSEGAVFQAIGAGAQALLELQAKHPNAVEAFELFIATDHRLRAGQFLITQERAQELVGKQLDLTAFYLKYVEF